MAPRTSMKSTFRNERLSGGRLEQSASRSGPDPFEQPILHIVEDGIMLNDGKILGLGQKLLVGIYTRAKHLRLLRAHLTHLLRHLVGSWGREEACQREGLRDGEVISAGLMMAWGGLPLSLPSIKLKTGCSPKMQRKYHEMLDIHLGSISLVATPAWSMLLNLMVRGNGNFTAQDGHSHVSHNILLDLSSPKEIENRRTDNVSAEEGINPAHDHGVGDDHGHLPLHGAHHALHGVGVCHGVGRRLAPVLGRAEERARLVRGRQGVAPRAE